MNQRPDDIDSFLRLLQTYGCGVVRFLEKDWPDQSWEIQRHVRSLDGLEEEYIRGTVDLLIGCLGRAVFRGPFPNEHKAALVDIQLSWARLLINAGEREAAAEYLQEVVDYGLGRSASKEVLKEASALMALHVSE